jgi:hypothetical protein
MASTKPPIEGKVWGATAGGTAGSVIASFVLWVLGVTLFGVSTDALSATEAISAVPWPIIGVVGLGITIGATFFGGWLTKHTPRPEGVYSPKRELVEPEEGIGETSDSTNLDQSDTYPVPEYPGPNVESTKD